MTSASNAPRALSWAMANGLAEAKRFSEWCFDSVFAGLLVAAASVNLLIVSRRRELSIGLVFLYVIGSAAFNRDFAYLRVGPLYVTEVILGLLVTLLAVHSIQQGNRFLPASSAERRVVLLLAIFLLWGLVRVSPELLLGSPFLATLRNFAIVYYGLFALCSYLVFRDFYGKRSILAMFVIVVTAATIANSWRMLAYFLEFGGVYDPFTKVVAGHAVLFSLFGAVILSERLMHVNQRLFYLQRLFLIIALFINLVAVYFSGHRTALIALAIGLIPVIANKMSARKLIVIAVVLSMGAAAFLQSPAIREAALTVAVKYQTLGSPFEEDNALWRYMYWLAVANVWLTSPVTGVGFAHDLSQQEPWAIDVERGDPHNSYLALLARTGIVGMGFLIGLVLSFIFLMNRIARLSMQASAASLARMTLGCFFVIGVYAALNVTLESPYHAPFFWIFIGMGVALSERERQSE